MLLTITHLKAPWPAGAKVGDVVDLPAVPAWAVGKCKPAADGAMATVGTLPVEVAGDEVTGDGSGETLPPIDLPHAQDKPRKAK